MADGWLFSDEIPDAPAQRVRRPARRIPALAFEQGWLTLSGADNAPGAPFEWHEDTQQWRCAAMHYRRVKTAAAGRARDLLAVPEILHWPRVSLPQLNGSQFAALDAWEHAGRQGQIIMPARADQMTVALAAMARCGVATLIVAPLRDLMYPWQRRIEQALGYRAGVLDDGRREIWPVTLATYDDACRHMAQVGDHFGLVVFDAEAYLAAPTRRLAAERCAASWRMGLANPSERWRAVQSPLDELVGPVVFQQKAGSADGPMPPPYELIHIPVALPVDEQRRYDDQCRLVRQFMASQARAGAVAGTGRRKRGYGLEELRADAASDRAARRAWRAYEARQALETRADDYLRILEDLLKLHAGERVLVFADTDALAQAVGRHFQSSTIAESTGRKQRAATLAAFRDGQAKVLTTSRALGRSEAVPGLGVAVALGGLDSIRGLRTCLARLFGCEVGVAAIVYEVVYAETGGEARSRVRRGDTTARERRGRKRGRY